MLGLFLYICVMNKFNTSYFKIKESKLIEFLEAQIDDSGLDKHHLDIIKSRYKEITIKYDGNDISSGLITIFSTKKDAN